MSAVIDRIRALRSTLFERDTEEKALRWTPCELCDYDIATGEGQRSCHYYSCPYLPDELNVFCPTCNYDFFTREGAPECSDPPSCEYARDEAPKRVALVEAWVTRHPGGEIGEAS